jgi:hypothetical protein
MVEKQMKVKYKTWEEIQENLRTRQIMEVALSSEEPLLQALVNQILLMTKLLHPEECQNKISNNLTRFGFTDEN